MPHIIIKCYKGRSKEKLEKVAKGIAKACAEEFEVGLDQVSVSIEEVEKENWKEVYDNEIYGNKDTLYIEPKYTVE